MIRYCMLLAVALLTLSLEAAAQTPTRPAPGAIDVEMLTRAEHRADALQSQLLDLQMKEIELWACIEEIDYRMRPENIQKALAFVGSPRPMDELRDDLRKRLESEKDRVSQQLELLTSTRARVEAALRDAEAECVRLRKRLRSGSATDMGEEVIGLASRKGDSSSFESQEANQ